MYLNTFLFLLLFSLPSLADKKKNNNIKPEQLIRMLTIGDSLTAGYGLVKSEAYPYQVESLINKAKIRIKITNAGVSGSTSASCYSRLKWQLKAKPQILMIALGANDGLRGINLDSTKKNLIKCIDLALKNKMKVIFAGMKLPYNYGKKYRAKFEGLYEQISKTKKVVFIPFLLEGVGGVKKLNLPDGIHPNAKGHKLIAKKIQSTIESVL